MKLESDVSLENRTNINLKIAQGVCNSICELLDIKEEIPITEDFKAEGRNCGLFTITLSDTFAVKISSPLSKKEIKILLPFKKVVSRKHKIAFTPGALEKISSFEGLVFMLGHEIGHLCINTFAYTRSWRGRFCRCFLLNKYFKELRRHEYRADLFSCSIMKELGFSNSQILGAVQYWRNCFCNEVEEGAKETTHPSVDKRIACMQEYLRNE